METPDYFHNWLKNEILTVNHNIDKLLTRRDTLKEIEWEYDKCKHRTTHTPKVENKE